VRRPVGEHEAALYNLTGNRCHPSPSPFSLFPLSLPLLQWWRGHSQAHQRWCPASAATRKKLPIFLSIRARPRGRAGGKRPPPFYRNCLYWSSVLCSPLWLVRCRTLAATVSSAVLSPILIGIKAPRPRGSCVVCTRRASLRACFWLLLLLWPVSWVDEFFLDFFVA
jgi:hypothetical protein